MDAVKFIKERGRVCRFYHHAGDCYQCPVKDCECSVPDAFSDNNSEIERVRELLKAYKEGRLIVLPCKVGDELWQIDDDFYALRIKYFSTYHGRTVINADVRMLQPDDIDNFRYISREEVMPDE